MSRSKSRKLLTAVEASEMPRAARCHDDEKRCYCGRAHQSRFLFTTATMVMHCRP